MHKILATVSMVALFALTACGQKEKEASCENVLDNLISFMAKEAKTDQEKAEVEALVKMSKDEDEMADAIKECRAARPSAEALRCAANAKTLEEFAGCGLPMLN